MVSRYGLLHTVRVWWSAACKMDAEQRNASSGATTPANTQTLLPLLPLLLAKLRPSRHFQSPHTATRQDKFRIDASEPLSRSLIERVARHKTAQRPAGPPSSCIQLPFPAPDPAQVRWALPTPPYPPSLTQSQHAGRPLPCRYLRYDILLPASQICLGNHLSQQCPLTGCFAFLLLLVLFLASLHTHHPYSPPPSHFTWSLIQSPSLSAVCHLRTISQGLVTGSSVLSCLSSEPPSVDIVCPGDIYSRGKEERQGLLFKPWGHPGQSKSVCSWFAGLWFVPNLLPIPPSPRKGSACEADGSSDRGDNHHPGQGAFGSQTNLRQP